MNEWCVAYSVKDIQIALSIYLNRQEVIKKIGKVQNGDWLADQYLYMEKEMMTERDKSFDTETVEIILEEGMNSEWSDLVDQRIQQSESQEMSETSEVTTQKLMQ